MQDKTSVFAGIKVLAAVRVIAAPFATYHLAMHGADVLSVENPKEPDSMRYSGDYGTELNKQGMGSGFLAQNANKRSMTLNFADPRGQEIFKRLAKEADIVAENLVAGTMPRYGLGYEDLKKIKPDLIYCSITGYGQTGPIARRAAIDGAIQAAGGVMAQTGTPETGPLKVGFTMVDYSTGYAAALAMSMALFHRERTGEGQYIDVAMLDTAITMNSASATRAATTGQLSKLAGNGSGHGGYISDCFRCKEGSITVAATTPNRRLKVYKGIGREDLATDPRFCTPDLGRANYAQLREEIQKTLLTRPAIEWEERIAAQGGPAMAVRDMSQAIANPQIVHRWLMHTFAPDPELGLSITVPKAAYQLSKTGAKLHSPPPRYGQHTDAVLEGMGYSAADITALRAEGVI
jgi:CoA:oxalate CoA-transferase